MLMFWGSSLIPPVRVWGDPNEDGLSCVPAIRATITCLSVGLYLLAGGPMSTLDQFVRDRRAAPFPATDLRKVDAGSIIFANKVEGGFKCPHFRAVTFFRLPVRLPSQR
jgi:hypothetical protein